MGSCISTFFLKTSISGRWNAAATVDLPFPSSSSSSSVPPRIEHPFRRIKAPVCIPTEAGSSFCLLFSSCAIYLLWNEWLQPLKNPFLCVSWQHSAQHRLSLPHTGADGSSRLRQEGADPPAVSGVLWILCLRVSKFSCCSWVYLSPVKHR